MTTPAERPLLFGAARSLVGILTEPVAAPAPAAFIFLNAGVVHRVGPNRIYVSAARRLASSGFLSARFDLSGLGDSGSRRDNTPFDEAAVAETREVMDAIQRDFGVARFVLVGLCSGAVVSFRGALADERVTGAVLINPQGFVQSQEFQSHVVARGKARRYWRDKVFSRQSWRRALTGRSHYGQLLEVLKSRAASFLTRNEAVEQIAGTLAAEFEQLGRRGVRFLLACSEGDYGVDYLSVILGPRFGRAERMVHLTLPPGDHSLTLPSSQQRLFDGIDAWAAAFHADPVARPARSACVSDARLAAAREQVS